MLAAVVLVQLQHGDEAFERPLDRRLRAGKGRGDVGPPVSQPVLQRLLKLFGRKRGAMPVDAEPERLEQAGAVKGVEQVVDDLVAEAGCGGGDVRPRGWPC